MPNRLCMAHYLKINKPYLNVLMNEKHELGRNKYPFKLWGHMYLIAPRSLSFAHPQPCSLIKLTYSLILKKLAVY